HSGLKSATLPSSLRTTTPREVAFKVDWSRQRVWRRSSVLGGTAAGDIGRTSDLGIIDGPERASGVPAGPARQEPVGLSLMRRSGWPQAGGLAGFRTPRPAGRILARVSRPSARRPEDGSGLGAAVLDALPINLYVVDRGMRVVAWNSQRERGPKGRPRREVLGRHLRDVLSPHGFRATLPFLEQVFVTGDAHEEILESLG